MQKVTPFLWFNDNAEDAIQYYEKVFKGSKVKNIQRKADGGFFCGTIELFGTELMFLNGGNYYKINEAVSFFIHCEDQDEVDHYWNKLSDGGKPLQCGWLTDKFGVTWQVVPKDLNKMLGDKDPQKAKRAMDAMMKMVKFDIAELKRAYEG